jgi:iron complex outermembrane receptor protein
MEEIGLHFHPHPLDWLHYETSFETVTGKKQDGDYLPLIPANNWNNTIRTEFSIKNWLDQGFATKFKFYFYKIMSAVSKLVLMVTL